MQTALAIAVGAAILLGLGLWARHRLESLPPKQKKALIKKTINSVFSWSKAAGSSRELQRTATTT